MKETSTFKAERGYVCKSVLMEGGTTGNHQQLTFFEEMIPTGHSSDSRGVLGVMEEEMKAMNIYTMHNISVGNSDLNITYMKI